MRAAWWFTMLLALPLLPLGAQAPVRLSLEDALRRADSTSEAVGIARAGVRGARGQVMQARSGWLPQLSGAVLYTRTLETQFSALAEGGDSTGNDGPPPPSPVDCTRFTPDPTLTFEERVTALERGLDCTANGDGGIDFSNLPFGRPNQWSFGLSASQTLFDPTLRGRIRSAQAGADRADAALDGARTRAVLDVAEAYLDAQLADRLLAIADSTLAQAERTFEDVSLARRVGTAAEFDELRASVARDNQRPVVILRRTQRDQALLRLRQLLDLDTTTPIELTTPLGDTTDLALPDHLSAALADTTVASRVAVREADAAVAAAEGALSSARGSRLPSVRLSSDYTKVTFPDDVFRWEEFLTDWTVSARVSVPLFTGGRLKGEVIAAEAAADEARLRARQVREQAEREVIEVYDVLGAAEAAWEASAGTAEQAARAYAIAEVRVREGLSTQTDLNDARLQLQQAEANRAQAARDLLASRLRVLLLRDLPLGTGAALMGAPR